MLTIVNDAHHTDGTTLFSFSHDCFLSLLKSFRNQWFKRHKVSKTSFTRSTEKMRQRFTPLQGTAVNIFCGNEQRTISFAKQIPTVIRIAYSFAEPTTTFCVTRRWINRTNAGLHYQKLYARVTHIWGNRKGLTFRRLPLRSQYLPHQVSFFIF